MPSLRGLLAEDVIGYQVDAYLTLRDLGHHGTVRGNARLTSLVSQASEAVRQANMAACAVLFPGDTLADVAPRPYPGLELVVVDGETRLGQRRAKERAQAGQVPEPVDAA